METTIITKRLEDSGLQIRREVRASRPGIATFVANPDTRFDLTGKLTIDESALQPGDWVAVIEHRQRRRQDGQSGLVTVGLTSRALTHKETGVVDGGTIELPGGIVAGIGSGVNVAGIETRPSA